MIAGSAGFENGAAPEIALSMLVYKTSGGACARQKWRAGRVLRPLYLLIDNQASMLLDFLPVVRRERICTLTVRGHMFYRHAGSLVPRRRNLKWWTATALHRALPLARRVTS
jgi:hypothetical protein